MGRKLQLTKSNFSDPQWEFITDRTTKKLCFMAGYGAGKTIAFRAKTLIEHVFSIDPQTGKSYGIIVYPIYQLAEEVFVGPFLKMLKDFNIPYKYNSQRHTILTDYGKILIYQMVKPENIVGTGATFVGVDELDVASMKNAKVTVDKLIGRARGKEGVQLYITSTPEGYNYLNYEFYALTPEQRAEQNKRLIIASTYSNERFLPSDYIPNLKASLDPKLFQQYVMGIPQNLSVGAIYYSFDEYVNVIDMDLGSVPESIFVGCDFNINPNTAVIAKIENDNVYVFDEIYLQPGNTEQMATEIRSRYPNSTIHIYPDNTGNKRQTSADVGKTDISILQEPRFGFNVIQKRKSNYLKIDRYATVNRFLLNGVGETRLFISPNCQHLIDDLIQVSYKEGTRNPDESNKNLTHISDALGYLITGHFGITEHNFTQLSAADNEYMEQFKRELYSIG